MSVVGDEEVPAEMPWWCHVAIAVPAVVAGLTLLATGAQDPYAVLLWATGSYWVTGAAARWALRRQGHFEVVVEGWVEKGMNPRWLLVPMVAFAVWVSVDTVQTAMSPAGDWWDWGFVVLLGGFWLFGLALAVGAAGDWRRRRSS